LRGDPRPFSFRRKSATAPSQTLSITKTIKHFSSLSAKDLQEILVKSAKRAGENKAAVQVLQEKKEFLELFIYQRWGVRGNPGEAGGGVVISDAQGRTIKS